MLHEEETPPADEVILLRDDARRCVVTYRPHFLSEVEADALFAALSTITPFHAEAPVMFGRAIEVRRRTYAFGEPGTRYRYAGVERVAAPWPDVLLPTVERIRARTGTQFTFALCNLYPTARPGSAGTPTTSATSSQGHPSLRSRSARSVTSRCASDGKAPPCSRCRSATDPSSS